MTDILASSEPRVYLCARYARHEELRNMGGILACNIDGILTPSECAKLSEIEAKMTRGGVLPLGSWTYLASILVNAAPRMLATIEALRADVASLKAANDELQRDSDDRDERIDTQYRTIAAHEATIAELRGEAERRSADIQDIRVTVAELRKELEERT